MIDVHEPHETVHTWRDFFIHIATIVIGLLIAIGLEQTVEAVHRHHQLHRLQEDVQAECEANIERGFINLRHLDLDMAWLLELHNRIQTLHTPQGKRAFVYPVPPVGYPGDPHSTDRALFLNAVWSNARQAAIIDLLPDSDAQLYNRFYSLIDIQLQDFDNLTMGWEKIPAFEFPFRTGSASARLEVERMSDAQIDEYATAVSQVYMSAQFNKRLLQILQAWNAQAVGPRTMPDIAQYLKTHVDPLPPYTAPATPAH